MRHILKISLCTYFVPPKGTITPLKVDLFISMIHMYLNIVK